MHIRDYVEHLKAKPEHVRRRIALGTSMGVTGLVFVGWLVAMGASGTLALASPVEGEQSPGLAQAAKETQSGFSSLLGAASAFTSGGTGVAPLTIVDGKASTTLDEQNTTDERTVIPF